MKQSLICLAICGFAVHAEPGKTPDSKEANNPDIVVKTTSTESDSAKTETTRYFRNGRNVMTFQTIVRPDKTITSTIFLGVDSDIIGMPVVDGKISKAFVEPSSYVIAIEDKDRDGELDNVEILDDDMNLIEAYRKAPGSPLLPLDTRKLNEIISERKKAYEKMMNRGKEGGAPAE